MISCVRVLEFDAGHRVMRHESKCRNLHGHRYKVEVHAEAPELDDLGRVIDFSILKLKIGSWLDENWDHGCIIFKEDVEVIEALKSIPGQKIFLLDTNPTAENMAEYLLNTVCPYFLAGTGVRVKKIVVWETPNCYAVASVER